MPCELFELSNNVKWGVSKNLKKRRISSPSIHVNFFFFDSAPKSPLNVNAMEFHPPSTPGVGGNGDQNPMTAGYLASATASLTSMLSVNSASQLPLAPTIQQGQVRHCIFFGFFFDIKLRFR